MSLFRLSGERGLGGVVIAASRRLDRCRRLIPEELGFGLLLHRGEGRSEPARRGGPLRTTTQLVPVNDSHHRGRYLWATDEGPNAAHGQVTTWSCLWEPS